MSDRFHYILQVVRKHIMHFYFFKLCNTATDAIFCILLVIIALIASSGSIAIPSFAPTTHIVSNKNIDAEAILVWNNLTTQIGIREKLSPPEFSRAYALVHISMYDSLIAATANKQDRNVIFYDNRSSAYVSSICRWRS